MEITAVEKNKIVEEAIIKVIVFFDLFDFPLTAFEVWKYAGVKCGLAEVMEELEMIIKRHSPRGETVPEQKSYVFTEHDESRPNPLFAKERGTFYQGSVMEMKNGFYFLAGRREIVDIRAKRYNFTAKKFKRAVRVAKVFKFIPWIKMIAVGNIMGGNNAKPESDIDLFIITAKKRVWITRFFCVVIAKLSGMRPRNDKTRDTICLSFFTSEAAMDLRGVMLNAKSGKMADDIYFIYWLACLGPVYDRDGTYEKFIKANHWISEVLPNWRPFAGIHWRDAGRSPSFFYRDMLEMLFGGLEVNFKHWQNKKFPPAIKELMNKDMRVVVTDEMLKLHVNDRREEYRDKWKALIEKYKQ